LGGLISLLAALWILLARPVIVRSRANLPANPVDPHVLREHVEMLSQRLLPRDDRHPENLAKVADYIAASLKSAGARVTFEEFTVNNQLYNNVIADYGPGDGPVIVIGAHYDTAGEQPGADDNASGVAGLLELGRLLDGKRLDTKIVLAAYTLEEPPHFGTINMGSAVHAKALRRDRVEVKLMISVEMIGYYSEQQNSQGFPSALLKLFYPSAGNFIIVVDRIWSNLGARVKKSLSSVIELPVYSINAPRLIPGIDFSDHVNFWNLGYPAVMVTDTSFYRNAAYHSARDTAERLNYPNMAQVIFGIYHFIMQSANPGHNN
jgi:Zn-dependent M28 family amino/carboxypeptidase